MLLLYPIRLSISVPCLPARNSRIVEKTSRFSVRAPEQRIESLRSPELKPFTNIVSPADLNEIDTSLEVSDCDSVDNFVSSFTGSLVSDYSGSVDDNSEQKSPERKANIYRRRQKLKTVQMSV